MPITQFCTIKIFYIAVMISGAHYRVISDIFRNRVTWTSGFLRKLWYI